MLFKWAEADRSAWMTGQQKLQHACAEEGASRHNAWIVNVRQPKHNSGTGLSGNALQTHVEGGVTNSSCAGAACSGCLHVLAAYKLFMNLNVVRRSN
jgi:hypothetical protein